MSPAPSGPPVSVRCPAKVNLFLEVLGRRADGFHDIETVMVPAPCGDLLEAAPGPAGSVSLDLRFAGAPHPGVPAGEGNLAVRAARLVLAAAGSRAGVRLSLLKEVPPGAGLGGGSSDAAGALRAVNRLLGDPLPEERLADLALSLGSDVPYFLRGGAVLARGRGEVLEEVPAPAPPRLLVLFPGFPLSTAEVYARCRPPAAAARRGPGEVLDALARGDGEALAGACFNRLEEPARAAAPDLASIQDRWRALGRGAVHMSGSGSACFRVLSGGESGTTLARGFLEGLPGRGAAWSEG